MYNIYIKNRKAALELRFPYTGGVWTHPFMGTILISINTKNFMRFNPLMWIVILLSLLTGGAAVTLLQQTEGGEAPSTLNEYYSSIDYTCKQDNDCAVKDVHNCCGFYPQCVNRRARTNPNLVELLCTKEGAASVCGFRDVKTCECVQGRCRAVKT